MRDSVPRAGGDEPISTPLRNGALEAVFPARAGMNRLDLNGHSRDVALGVPRAGGDEPITLGTYQGLYPKSKCSPRGRG